MCDTATKQLVETTVNGFIGKGFMFTAFDITKFLRAAGQKVSHRHVNDGVKEMFRDNEMGQYVRDTKDVGAPVAPFVYYHPYSDIANYDSGWLENNPSQDGMKNDASADGSQSADPANQTATTAQVAPVAQVSPSLPSLPKGQFAPNKEGRLTISSLLTKQLGLVPKQTVWVEQKGYELVIRQKQTGSSVWPISVNSDGRIRVCSTILSKIANPVYVPYKVWALSGDIIVEKV